RAAEHAGGSREAARGVGVAGQARDYTTADLPSPVVEALNPSSIADGDPTIVRRRSRRVRPNRHDGETGSGARELVEQRIPSRACEPPKRLYHRTRNVRDDL